VHGGDESASDLGALLRAHRAGRGLTQEELAELSALSVRAIADMERGRTARPYRRSLQRLATALDLSAGERDKLERAARLPRVISVASHPDQPGDSGARTAAGPVRSAVVPQYLPAQLDELRRLTSLLLDVRDVLGSLLGPAAGAAAEYPDDSPTNVCD